MSEFNHRATYSPDDNKLRMYPDFRLDKEDYLRFKSAGFGWAPRQELFVAGKWTPSREDLLIEFCGSIGDEDTTLTERSEERAERFEGYSEKRLAEAHQAKDGVSAIADGIPMGQPILVGHHSEKRARKDAQKIENGMRKAVQMWETSKYWEDRAAGALHHAKYLERPEVRARRIKKIEADVRRCVGSYTPKKPDDTVMQSPWNCPICGTYYCKDHPEAEEQTPHVWCGDGRGGSWVQVSSLPGMEKRYARWIAHYEMRLLYEKAMLGEQGRLDLLEKPKRPKQLPLINYLAPDGLNIENQHHRGEFSLYPQVEMTKDEYKRLYSDYKGTKIIENSHRVRITCRANGEFGSRAIVFLTDSKVHKKPEPIVIEKEQRLTGDIFGGGSQTMYQPPAKTEFDDIKESLKAGVQTVVSDQLFPTPPDIAEKMVEYADIEKGDKVLEPSAGTGSLIQAIMNDDRAGSVVGVEINNDLCERLKTEFPLSFFHCKDFLDYNRSFTKFDRVIMNPPFKNGDDIKHIKHALTLLNDGGKLVAICADGPRQNDQLMPLADHWEKLPEGTFKNQGTMVNTALVVISGGAEQ